MRKNHKVGYATAFFFLNALLEWLLFPSFSLNSCCLIRKLNSTMAMENDTKQQNCNDFRCISFFGWRRWCTTKMVWTPYKNDLKLLMTRDKREVIYVAYDGFIACKRKKKALQKTIWTLQALGENETWMSQRLKFRRQ